MTTTIAIAGILMTDGELWKEQRRFAVRHLKDLGFGKSSLESLIMDEVNDLMGDLQVRPFRYIRRRDSDSM